MANDMDHPVVGGYCMVCCYMQELVIFTSEAKAPCSLPLLDKF